VQAGRGLTQVQAGSPAADGARASGGAGSPSAFSSASTVSPGAAAVPGEGPSGAEQAFRAAALQRRRNLFSASVRHPHAPANTPLARHQARGLGSRIPDGPSLFRQQGRASDGGSHDEPGRAISGGGDPAKLLIHEWLDRPRAAHGVASWNAQRNLEVGTGGKGVGVADARPELGNRADAGGRERELEAMRAEVKRCKAEITGLGRDRACLQHEVQRLTNALKEEQQMHQAIQREHQRRNVDLERMLQEQREQIRRLQEPFKEHSAATVSRSGRMQAREELECPGPEASRPAPAPPPRPSWLAAGVSGETHQPGASSGGFQRGQELGKARDVMKGSVKVARNERGWVAGDAAEECHGSRARQVPAARDERGDAAEEFQGNAGRVRKEGPMMIPIRELQIGRKRGVGSLPGLGEGGRLVQEEGVPAETARGTKVPRCAAERRVGVSGDGEEESRPARGFAFLSPSWWASFTGS